MTRTADSTDTATAPHNTAVMDLHPDETHLSQLRIRIARRGGVLVLQLAGQLDVYTIGGLRHRLEHVDPRARFLVVDLSKVDFVDSSGLGTLIFARSALARKGGRIGLVGAGPDLRDAFQIAGLGDALIHADSVDEACARLLHEPGTAP